MDKFYTRALPLQVIVLLWLVPLVVSSARAQEASAQAASAPQITSVTVAPLTYGAGEMIEVVFTTNGPFPGGNVFTAQISNLVGDFTTARIVGSVPSTSQGVIYGKLPCDLSDGIGYRIRVIASSPRVNGPDNGAPLVVRPRKPFEIELSGPTIFCPGDSVILTGHDGYMSYLWNTNDTTRTIIARQTGIYTLFVRDSNDCGLVARATVTVRNPPKPPIRLRNGVVLETDFGFASYQWNLDGEPIPDATEPTHKVAGVYGIYTVTVSDTVGCYGTSEPKKLPVLAAEEMETNDAAIRIATSEARDRASVELDMASRKPVAITLCDMNGRILLRIDEEHGAGHYRRDIPIGSLPAGAYLLHVKVGERSAVGKLVR